MDLFLKLMPFQIYFSRRKNLKALLQDKISKGVPMEITLTAGNPDALSLPTPQILNG